MAFNSVAEIYDSIDETRARLYQRAEALSEEQSAFQPTPDVWSAANIIEHLSLIEDMMIKLFNTLLQKSEASGGARDETQAFAPVSLDEFAEQARREKFTAPETVRPGGQVSLAGSLAHLRASREQLRALLPRIEKIDGAKLQYPHPAFGPLNLYQWLAFIGAHEERHLRQLDKLLQAANFKNEESDTSSAPS